MSGVVRNALFWLTAAATVFSAWRVFRTDSMVRAAYWLMVSFVGVGVVMVLLGAEFLGLVLLLMMAGEMTIMAVFMVMLMMNPAGLNPMTMVHQHRTSIAAGAVAFVALGAVGLVGRFPAAPPAPADDVTAALGRELLGDSMLIFETAGVTLLATMIGALAIASRRGRYGTADEGSVEPAADGSATGAAAVPGAAMAASPAAPAASSTVTETASVDDEHADHVMGPAAGDGNGDTTEVADHAAMAHAKSPNEHGG